MSQAATEITPTYHIAATKDYEKPTEAQHKMSVAGLKDLGNITTSFEGGEPKSRPVVQLTFKILDQKATDGSELLLFKRFTASLHPKADLAKMLAKFGIPVGKDGFTLNDVIGTTFIADVEYNTSKSDPTKVYANLGAISKSSVVLPAGLRSKAKTTRPVEPVEEVIEEFEI